MRLLLAALTAAFLPVALPASANDMPAQAFAYGQQAVPKPQARVRARPARKVVRRAVPRPQLEDPARLDRPWTAGDSHCLAIARAHGWPTAARNGAFTSDVPLQLLRVPRGAQVILCIGTNDATDPVRANGLAVAFDAVIDLAKQRGQQLVVFGPSWLNRKEWNARATLIDGELHWKLLHGSSFAYESIHHTRWPRRDGIHFYPRTYRDLGIRALELF